eukprot:308561-Prymnesium_polylepis.1
MNVVATAVHSTAVLRTTAPLKVLSASLSASIDCRSRWLDGSSSTRTCGLSIASRAKATRTRCPSESVCSGCTAAPLWPLGGPNAPSCVRRIGSAASGKHRYR